ncbi:hypothetical protein Mpsy_2283 [Methanolobus psychrophilus R15]|nr:hypothetical protein Mpsy_2283 [Methanolobus psychrophilus R15]
MGISLIDSILLSIADNLFTVSSTILGNTFMVLHKPSTFFRFIPTFLF